MSDGTLQVRPFDRSSNKLAKQVFFNGLVFFAVMLVMSLAIAWTLSQVTQGSAAITQSFTQEAGVVRTLVALERLVDDPKTYPAFAAATTQLASNPTAARPVIEAGAAWHQAQLTGQPTAALEAATRRALASYEAATRGQVQLAVATMEPQIRTAWRLGALRALLAIAFFVLLGWRHHHLLTRAFNTYISAAEAHNVELEHRVAERTRELAEARDQAQKANDAKSAFLANFSHELRTPLNAIIGYTDLLVEEVEPQEFAGRASTLQDLQQIRRASRHLLALIDDVLDLSKVEAGHMEILLESVNVRALVADVVEVVRPLAAKRDNTFEVSVEVGSEPVVTDHRLLRQSLLNLLSNACKFTENGHIDLVVRLVAGELSCAVTDTGIGMTPAQMNSLFQDYKQADASITRKYGGTGLGLAISQRFCHLLGGNLEVHSELGLGSTFTLRVPVATPIPT